MDYRKWQTTAAPDSSPDHFMVSWITPYQWHGQGIRWSATWGDSGQQSAYFCNSLTSTLFEQPRGPLSGLSSNVYSRGERLMEICAGDRLSYGFPCGLELDLAAEGRLVRMRSWHRVVYTPSDPESPDYEAAYEAQTWEANGFVSARYMRGMVEIAAGIGGYYFALFDQLAPSNGR